jgi:hypothetical protein
MVDLWLADAPLSAFAAGKSGFLEGPAFFARVSLSNRRPLARSKPLILETARAAVNAPAPREENRS